MVGNLDDSTLLYFPLFCIFVVRESNGEFQTHIEYSTTKLLIISLIVIIPLEYLKLVISNGNVSIDLICWISGTSTHCYYYHVVVLRFNDILPYIVLYPYVIIRHTVIDS